MMDEFYKKRDAWLVQILRHAIDQLQELRELDQLPKKRPVMWRVMNDNVWEVFSDEETAQKVADRLGVSYQGLYVRDGS